jgi:hypothetical protein
MHPSLEIIRFMIDDFNNSTFYIRNSNYMPPRLAF